MDIPPKVSICAEERSNGTAVVWRAWHFRSIFDNYTWDKEQGGFVFPSKSAVQEVVAGRFEIKWEKK